MSSPQETLRRAISATGSQVPTERISQPQQLEWFGGNGDGVTDNTAAFVAAQLAAGVGGEVLLRPGKNYFVASTVFVQRDYARIIGFGATISFLPALGTALYFNGKTGCSLVGVTLDGGASAALMPPTGVGAIHIANSNEISITGCRINNVRDVGIKVDGLSYGVVIEKNRFYHFFNAVLVDDDGATNQPVLVRISGNHFKDGWSASASFSGAIKISGIAGPVMHVIADNIIIDSGEMGIEVQGPDNFTIVGNTVLRAVFGISVSESDHAVVSGNVLTDSAFNGIEVASNSRDVSVCGNTVSYTSVVSPAGIAVASSTARVAISGNTIFGNGNLDRCVNVIGSQDVTISGNKLSAANQLVYVQDSSSVNISGNVFSDGGFASPFACVFLDATDTSVTGVIISNNIVTSNVAFNSFIFLFTPNASVVSDVVVSGNNLNGTFFAGGTWNGSAGAQKSVRIRVEGNGGWSDGGSANHALTFTSWAQSGNVAYAYGQYYLDRGCVFMDASGGNRTFQLPPPDVCGAGYEISLMKADASGNTVTVNPYAAEQINFAANYVLSTQGQRVTLTTDGTDWFVKNAS